MRRLFEVLLPYRDQLGIVASGSLVLGLVATTLGQLALGLGDGTGAIELLDEAVARADAMGAPYEGGQGRRFLAEALLGRDRGTDRVGPMVEAAVAVAEQHGFAGEQAALTALLERSGLR